ncbi:helix-turn-helix domain-containing protein [Streptococcus porcinus]|uniref:Transcriptional regulator n=1 Tax=Streptococcus porcinus TaxID=1340 RepID=A0A4V0H840_STRPO|nr:helix-turn-helix transcriptional regulator [Streptococcus porcinus]VTT44615.1 transcriptional regulator [Streptococcus porcinus]VTT45979.1 transcriptional regulator [Streptococcus porcinus]
MKVNNKEVGQRIKNIRLGLGESMDQFGSRFNTSRGTINNWEKGRNLPNNKNLLLIAKLGNRTIDEILYGDYDTFLLFKIRDLVPKFVDNIDKQSDKLDEISYNIFTIAKSQITNNDYQISENKLKLIIINTIKNSLDYQGELIKNDLANFDYSNFGSLIDEEYYYFGYTLKNKFNDKLLFTSVLAILNKTTKTIYIDDLSRERFFNFLSDDLLIRVSTMKDDIAPNQVIPFSTYIKYRSKIFHDILEEMLWLPFLSNKIDISGFTIKILKEQTINHKTIKLNNK